LYLGIIRSRWQSQTVFARFASQDDLLSKSGDRVGLTACGLPVLGCKLARMSGSINEMQSEHEVRIDWSTGSMDGPATKTSVKRLGQLEGIFVDHEAWRSLSSEIVVYSVQWQEPVAPKTNGGLFWGATTIEAGTVGGEYFMTRGHFHEIRNRGEYYCTVQGDGMLLLMDEERRTRVERMFPGSLHYIAGLIAHRTVNVGNTPLVFWACWPSDAGHDYQTIEKQQFSARVYLRNGEPKVVWEAAVDELQGQTADAIERIARVSA
jgi:glucose-6-phosphate isomerase